MKLEMNMDNVTYTDEVAYTQAGTSVNLEASKGFLFQTSATVTTPSGLAFATTDVDVDNDTITETAHGFVEGLKGQLTTTTTLPAGLSLATDYFVIVVDANTYSLATSLALAQAGTAVDITDVGTGTHTFTATALAGGVVKLQKSIDNSVWFDISGATSNITATGDVELLEKVDPMYKYVRPYYTMTAGQVSYANNVLVNRSAGV